MSSISFGCRKKLWLKFYDGIIYVSCYMYNFESVKLCLYFTTVLLGFDYETPPSVDGMTFSIPPTAYYATDDTTLFNVLQTPLFLLPGNSIVKFYAYISSYTNTAHLDVYVTFVLGQPMRLLASYDQGSVDAQQNIVALCVVGAGEHRLAFVAFAEPFEMILISKAEVTTETCKYDTLTKYISKILKILK